MYEPPKNRKCGLYWAVEQLVADSAACSMFVMKETITNPVVRSHLKRLYKNARTPSLTLAPAVRKKVMRAISQTGLHHDELCVESVGDDSIFGESQAGENSTFGVSTVS
jgi:hypothetical protein